MRLGRLTKRQHSADVEGNARPADDEAELTHGRRLRKIAVLRKERVFFLSHGTRVNRTPVPPSLNRMVLHRLSIPSGLARASACIILFSSTYERDFLHDSCFLYGVVSLPTDTDSDGRRLNEFWPRLGSRPRVRKVRSANRPHVIVPPFRLLPPLDPRLVGSVLPSF